MKGKIFVILGYIVGITGVLFRIYNLIQNISTYPFIVGWAESGRIFDAFQIYSPILIRKFLSWPWLDPSRAILDGMIFLVPNIPIWLYRLWGAILFLIVIGLFLLIVVRKAKTLSVENHNINIEKSILIIIWGYLFLMQLPVYYHVLVGIIPVIWLYDRNKPLRNLLIIILCSLWESVSRVNWFIMPAVITILLFIFTTPKKGKSFISYFLWPTIYLLAGGLVSICFHLIYLKFIGYPLVFFNPNMKYFFFLYKLWPNNLTIGLIPSILLASLPILAIILYLTIINWKKIQLVRIVVVAILFGIFFIGSTYISLRAGGGFDIHNYDTFIVLIFTTLCFFGFNSFIFDEGKIKQNNPFLNYGFILLLLIPTTLSKIPNGSLISNNRESNNTKAVINDINNIIQVTNATDEHPILFIDQRQLFIFNYVKYQNIFVPYEKVELMEMAMANNKVYRSKFINDIDNQKFQLIISDILGPWIKPIYDPKNKNSIDSDNFWYENNVYVNLVSKPILRNYDLIYINKEYGVAIYKPK